MKWLKIFRAWRLIADTGVWQYWENEITGRRFVLRVGTGHQPIAQGWDS